MTRTLHIDVLGKLWMGGNAATTLRVTVSDGPWEVAFDDPTDLDEVWAYVATHTGDFAAVYAIDATYIEETTERIETGPDAYHLNIDVRTVQLASFTDEQACDFSDCYAA